MRRSSALSLRVLLANVGWLACGEVIGRVFALVVALYLARTLGSAGYGTIGIAASVLGFIRIGLRIGSGAIGIREVARSPTSLPAVYAELAGLRLAIAGALLVPLVLVSPFLGAALAVPASLLILYALQLIPYALLPLWAYRGLERMKPVATLRALESALVLTGLALLVRGPDAPLYLVPLVQLAALVAVTAWLLLSLSRHYGVLRVGVPRRSSSRLVGEGILISAGALLETFYREGDVLMLGWLTDATVASEFLVSHKIVLTLLLVPMILQQAVYPATSRIAASAPQRALALHAIAFRYTLAVLVPAIAFFAVFAEETIELLFGVQYAGAASVLPIVLLTLPLASAGQSLKRLLLSAVASRALVIGYGVGVVAHVAAALMLIPTYSAVGAAWACLAGEAASTTALTWLCVRALGGTPWDLRSLAPLAAGAVSVGAALAASAYGAVAQIAAGAVVYTAGVFVLRAVTASELLLLRDRVLERRQNELDDDDGVEL